MTGVDLSAMGLEEALGALRSRQPPPKVQVVAVSPPKGSKTCRWRVARVGEKADGTVVVTAVAEIEGTIGCNEPLAQK